MRALEHRIQAAVFLWARLASAKHPALRLMFAVPNGGARNVITGALLKAEGMKAGVPDIFLPHPVAPHHGLFLELKAARGRISPQQCEWLSALEQQGYACAVCNGIAEATETITAYLEGRFGQVDARPN